MNANSVCQQMQSANREMCATVIRHMISNFKVNATFEEMMASCGYTEYVSAKSASQTSTQPVEVSKKSVTFEEAPVPEPVVAPAAAIEAVIQPAPVVVVAAPPKPEKAVKFSLPFCRGTVDSALCQALVKNNGLYTQCPKKRADPNANYCIGCAAAASAINKPYPAEGNVQLRLAAPSYMDYRTPEGGDKPVPYLRYLASKKVTVEDAVAKATELGVVIPDEHLVEPTESKRGRPKAAVVAASLPNQDMFAQVAPATVPETAPAVVVVASEPVVAPVVEVPAPEPVTVAKKPRKPYTKKNTNVVLLADNATRIDCKIVTHNGKKCLQGTNNVVYDQQSHEPVAYFDPDTKKILPVKHAADSADIYSSTVTIEGDVTMDDLDSDLDA